MRFYPTLILRELFLTYNYQSEIYVLTRCSLLTYFPSLFISSIRYHWIRFRSMPIVYALLCISIYEFLKLINNVTFPIRVYFDYFWNEGGLGSYITAKYQYRVTKFRSLKLKYVQDLRFIKWEIDILRLEIRCQVCMQLAIMKF